TSENEMLFEPGQTGLALEFSSPFAVAHQKEFDPRAVPDQRRRDCDQRFVSFEPGKSRNLSNNDVITSKTQMRSRGGVIPGSEKRVELKAAQDFRVLFRIADASGEVLFFHGVA